MPRPAAKSRRIDLSGRCAQVEEDGYREDATLDIEEPETLRAVFYGIGSDGTVSANKNTIKILGSDPAVHAQAYFVLDSKKSGGMTVSHLRFGPHEIRAPYLVSRAGWSMP